MAKARIEFITLGNGTGHDGTPANCIKACYGVTSVTVGTTATASGDRPVAPAFPEKVGLARVTALDGALIVAWGPNPTASQTGLGIWIEAGGYEVVPVREGDKLSFIGAVR